MMTFTLACLPVFFLKKNPGGYTKLLKVPVGLKRYRRSFFNSRCIRKLASTLIDTEKPLLKDLDGEDVDLHTYRSMIGSLNYLTSSRPEIMFVVCAYARFQVTSKASHSHAVKRIFSDYAGARLDRKSTTKGYQFLDIIVRLQALIDRRKVIISKGMVRQALQLDDADSIDCLTNEEIFVELEMIGVGKGFSRVDTPLFEGMFVPQQVNDDVADDVVDDVDDNDSSKQGEIAKLDVDEDVTLEEVVADLTKDTEDDEAKPAKVKEVIEVVTTAKLMTEVVTTAPTTITAAPSAASRRNGILVKEPKPLKKQAQIKPDEAYARELEAELNENINWNGVIDSIVGFLGKGEEQLEEGASKALKRKSESSEQQAAKKHKLDEEVEELKTHLQIVPNNEDDVWNSPAILKLHQLIKEFDREDLEMLWQIVQERFASSKPKNFSNDFLLNTLKAMFEKPNVEASIWKSQRGSYGLAKVKSWKLLESSRVYIITFKTTQTILVERSYPLTRFTLDQMLNDVKLEVEEESEVSLELLIFVRRQQQEGYRLEKRVWIHPPQ
nr:hypothetical protein [Tanacetum cinerariifolium]